MKNRKYNIILQLDKDELVGVSVEDDNGYTAVTSHQVPDLLLAILTVLHSHWGQVFGLCQGHQANIFYLLHCYV